VGYVQSLQRCSTGVSANLHSSAGQHGYAAAVVEVGRMVGMNPRQLHRLHAAGERFLTHAVDLLPYVPESLQFLEGHRLCLMTKGNAEEQHRKLADSGLRRAFDEILILEGKSPDVFATVFAERGWRGHCTLFIGNSVQHDIIPAVQNGASAIWMNHSNNVHGRNAVLPEGVVEIDGWLPIYSALVELTNPCDASTER
jgi:hypothetical protein